MSMVERKIFRIIDDRLAWFKEDDGQRFERFVLGELALDTEEAAKARVFFAGGTAPSGEEVEARPPTLIHGYARTGGPFPCWALVLGSERESGTYMNDDALAVDEDGERYYDPETGEVVDAKVRIVEYTFNIMVLADHPDVTLWYYHLLKRIILSEHDAFLEAGLTDPPNISGADLAPDPRYLPSDVFVRQLTLAVTAEECWTEALEGGFSTTVAGIAIDDTGNQVTRGDTAGRATAKITPYTAGS